MSSAVLAVIALVITVLAVRFDGLNSSEVDVSDGTVWVNNRQASLLGRLNVDAEEFDARLRSVGEDLDILQSGYHVIETGPRGFTVINTAAVDRPALTPLPAEHRIALGGDRVAISLGKQGVWILSPEEAAAFDPGQLDPNLEAKNALINVTRDGTVHVLDGDTLQVLPRSEQTRRTTASETAQIEGLSGRPENLELTSVGEVPVILDKENRLLRIGLDGQAVDLTEEGVTDLSTARLQQPSGESSHVLLSTNDRLFEIPLGGGTINSFSAGGTGEPVAPVRIAECSYAAWGGANTYLRTCDGQEQTGRPIPSVKSTADLVLRQNRDLVVLNDQEFGLNWMIADDMRLVDNWKITQKIEKDTKKQKEKESLSSTITNIAASRDEKNRPPIANDDAFGVRPGQSVVLPVTRNDTDPDGDVLTATVRGDQPGVGRVTPIRGGTQMQIEVAEDATGTARYSYEVNDGRGGTDTATVTLTVRSPEENRAPELADERTPKVKVRSGKEVTFNINPYWQDPDGDAFYLSDAQVDAKSQDTVSFRPDGVITLTDAGTETGDKKVQLVFRDEKGASAEGELLVESTSDADLAPVTTADHARIVAGRTTTIKPLVNDLNPNGGELELLQVSESSGLEVDAALQAGTVDVSSLAEGTHYLTYTVGASGGATTSQGLIRVDVVAPESENLVPVAVDDIGNLITGTDTLVDPLENDVDPTGGVLVVNRVTVPEGSGLKATVIGHHLIRVDAEPGAHVSDVPVPVEYEVANSAGSSTGTVRVMLASTDTQFASPVGVPDRAVVRAGDMVVIPAVANDMSPTNSRLRLGGLLETSSADAKGHIETNQDNVRFTANDNASGEVTATYSVVDETGRTGSAPITIRIIPREADNTAPRPQNLTARTVAGVPVRIPVRTTGIDPDGDSVMLMGITAPTPTKGKVTSATGEWIEYTPNPGETGTDRFTYQVADRHGAIGTAEVLVGIATPNEANQPPFAVNDIVEVKPEREVQIPVLENDTDPEGTPLSIDTSAVESLDEKLELLKQPATAGQFVTVKTPTEPGTYSALYGASDGQLTSTAAITVKVNPEAPALAPIARDDFVSPEEVLDPQTEQVEIDVLANDSDPDGSTNTLTVELENAPEGATLADDGRTLRIAPPAQLTRIRYTITDPDGLTSAGYVWIPGQEKQAPVWVGGEIEVQAGATAEIDLTSPKNVRVRPGAEPVQFADAKAVSASHHDGGQLISGTSTIVYRPAEGYVGKDTISARVTDGEPGAPTSAEATLAIPVSVVDKTKNLPPTLQGASLEAEQGGAAATVDLASGAKDPEGDPLTFALGEYTSNPDLAVSMSAEGVLQAEATATAAKGTSVSVPVTVSDGTNEPVPATVTVTVTGSTRPLPTAVLDEAQIDAGTTQTIEVLANDANPFPDTPLTLVDATLVSGKGAVTSSGSGVEISPDAEFHGILTARYRVQDKTADPDRVATGEIRVTVRGKPEPPTAPRIVAERDGEVQLSFTPGADNGAPITKYNVTAASGGSVTQGCESTTCTITGLTNGSTYTFRVTAVNEVGESEPSAASAEAMPDVRPEAPPTPSVKRGDGSLDIAWGAPVNRGSPIQNYDLQMRDANGTITSTKIEGDVRSHTASGLTNGVDYSFRVRASNLSETPSDWSGWSTPEHPAGPPKKPNGKVTAERINDPIGGAVSVSWPAMTKDETNGEPITEYIVKASTGEEMRAKGSATSVAFRNLDVKDKPITFTVTGVNSVGTGQAASNPSNGVTAFAVPLAPTNVKASLPDANTGDGPNGRVNLSWSAADGRGTPVTGYVVRWSGQSREVKGTSTQITGLDPHSAYTFTVQAKNGHQGGESEFSAPSASVTPYTKPAKPAIVTSAGTCLSATECHISYTVTANGDDGGKGPKTLRVWIDGKQQSVSGTKFSHTARYPSGSTHTIEADVVNGGKLESGRAQASQKANTYSPPAPKLDPNSWTWGAKTGVVDGCSGGNCRYFGFTLTNLQPHQSYTVRLANNGDPNFATFTLKADANGKATLAPNKWFYGFTKDHKPANPMRVFVNDVQVGSAYMPS